MIDVVELKASANGRWQGVVEYLGIDIGNGKHKPCPICGGKDRFRFSDENGSGSYFCNQCGPGDSIALIQKCLGYSFLETVDKIKSILGIVEFKPKEEKKYDVRAMLNNIWKSSKKLSPSDLVSRYLHKRGLVIEPKNIRYCPECYESDTKNKFPAMIAMVSDKNNKSIALHRTYLSGTKKADLKSPKKLTPGIKSLKGCSIKLFETKDVVGVAEGIETAIAATQLFDIPTWAAVGTSILESFEPPDDINKVVIFSDNDANFAGQKSAFVLASKLIDKDCVVNVEVPEIIGDWNDVLLKSRGI